MDDGGLRAMFAVIDARRWDELGEFFGPGIIYERPGLSPIRGLDRLLRFYQQERQITRSVHQLEGTVVDPGRGAAWGRVECDLADGTRTELGFADIYRFSRGVITLRRTHFFVPAV